MLLLVRLRQSGGDLREHWECRFQLVGDFGGDDIGWGQRVGAGRLLMGEVFIRGSYTQSLLVHGLERPSFLSKNSTFAFTPGESPMSVGKRSKVPD
jgi:hypothetical protein